jgi:hypothetical protein
MLANSSVDMTASFADIDGITPPQENLYTTPDLRAKGTLSLKGKHCDNLELLVKMKLSFSWGNASEIMPPNLRFSRLLLLPR